MIRFYWKSSCTSCKTARAWVNELAPAAEQREYYRKPLSEGEVKEILAFVGAVAPLLNTTHELCKARGWKAAPPSAEEFAAAAAKDNNLLRRPILVRDGKVVIGKDEAAIRALLC